MDSLRVADGGPCELISLYMLVEECVSSHDVTASQYKYNKPLVAWVCLCLR